jgi:hypothetical protein
MNRTGTAVKVPQCFRKKWKEKRRIVKRVRKRELENTLK